MDDGRQPIAIGELSDSGDLIMYISVSIVHIYCKYMQGRHLHRKEIIQLGYKRKQ